MNTLILTVFIALLVNSALIAGYFFTPYFHDAFYFLLAAFFILGISLAVLAIKMKMPGFLGLFLVMTGSAAATFVVSAMLHNMIAIFLGPPGARVDEPFFFIIAVFLCPLAFIIGAVGTIVLLVRK